MIKVEHLTKRFGNLKAVDNLSFEILPGQVVGLLGPNGAGKTTTMRLMTGFLSPDDGYVSVDGNNLEENIIDIQTTIGYLPEGNPMYRDMLVSEFLQFSAELKGVEQKHRSSALDFAVSSVDIENVYYRPIRELSKGYKQRVGIAGCLLAKPKIIIMDEPSEGLDPNQRTEIRSLIKKLAKDRTIIMSTHVMQEASAICSRILIINKGTLVAEGSPEELAHDLGKGTELIIVLEGSHVLPGIESIQGITIKHKKPLADNKTELRLHVGDTADVQREISRLAKHHDWVIWKLMEEEHKLEDIFHELTAGE